MPHYPEQIEYSQKYTDDHFEYRHVMLPKKNARELFALWKESDAKSTGILRSDGTVIADPAAQQGNSGSNSKPGEPRLLTEAEWRGLGVQMSCGWVHYEIHRPEPHILLFKRPLGTNPLTGLVDAPVPVKPAVAPSRPIQGVLMGGGNGLNVNLSHGFGFGLAGRHGA